MRKLAVLLLLATPQLVASTIYSDAFNQVVNCGGCSSIDNHALWTNTQSGYGGLPPLLSAADTGSSTSALPPFWTWNFDSQTSVSLSSASLHAYAQESFSCAAGPLCNNEGISSSYIFQSAAYSSFADTISIQSAQASSGFLDFDFAVDGSISTVQLSGTHVQAGAAITVCGPNPTAGIEISLGPACPIISSLGINYNLGSGTNTITVHVPWTFNQSGAFSVDLSAVDFIQFLTPIIGSDYAKVDFSNTATLVGLLPTDMDGNILTDTVVTGGSGFDYNALEQQTVADAVPEPATFSLFLLPLALLLIPSARKKVLALRLSAHEPSAR